MILTIGCDATSRPDAGAVGADAGSIAIGTVAIGEACADSLACVVDASCFFTDATMTTSVCMADCDPDTTRLCAMGEVCIPATLMGTPRELGVCFLGGSAAAGMPCVDTFDCARGTLCVSVVDEQRCHRACTVGGDGSECLATEVCQALVGMGMAGYCADTP
ncbi:MAG: hypothetical protein H6699_00165 [Myxococcales bacterium]|nr:hypothetical protein [Myxococcales bacterium]